MDTKKAKKANKAKKDVQTKVRSPNEVALLTLRQMNSDLEGALALMSMNKSAVALFVDDHTYGTLQGQITLLALACDQLADRVASYTERRQQEQPVEASRLESSE